MFSKRIWGFFQPPNGILFKSYLWGNLVLTTERRHEMIWHKCDNLIRENLRLVFVLLRGSKDARIRSKIPSANNSVWLTRHVMVLKNHWMLIRQPGHVVQFRILIKARLGSCPEWQATFVDCNWNLIVSGELSNGITHNTIAHVHKWTEVYSTK